MLFLVNEELLATPAGQQESNKMLTALDGFALVIESSGRVMFASEQIKEHLGMSQVCQNVGNRNVAIRRAKLGQIQGGGCRGPSKIRQRGVAIIFYFLRVKNRTLNASFYAKRLINAYF